jgi:hypothetical protein
MDNNNIRLPLDPVNVVPPAQEPPVITDPNAVPPVISPNQTEPPVVEPPVVEPPVIDPNTVEITGADGQTKQYKLDSAGNAINEDGTIAYTKEQLEEEPEAAEIDINKLVEEVGINITDESGNLVSFDNTPEGIAMYAKHLAANEYERGSKETLDKFMKANEDVFDMVRHKRIYGTLENYKDSINYSNITIDSKNEEQQLDLIKQSRALKGDTKEEVERFIKYSKIEGTLNKDAEEALKHLKGVQDKNEKVALAKQQAEIRAIEEQEINWFGVDVDNGKLVDKNIEDSIYDKIVKKGKVASLTIPKTGLVVTQADGSKRAVNRQEIFDYIYKPVHEDESGRLYSQAEIDEINNNKNKDVVLIRYLQNALGKDFNQLLKEEIQNIEAQNIRKLRVKGVQGTSNVRKEAKGNLVLPI